MEKLTLTEIEQMTQCKVIAPDNNYNNYVNHITIDSRMGCAYRGKTELMNNKMNGEFPIFNIGENEITWTGDVKRIEILPFWRWL